MERFSWRKKDFSLYNLVCIIKRYRCLSKHVHVSCNMLLFPAESLYITFIQDTIKSVIYNLSLIDISSSQHWIAFNKCYQWKLHDFINLDTMHCTRHYSESTYGAWQALPLYTLKNFPTHNHPELLVATK